MRYIRLPLRRIPGALFALLVLSGTAWAVLPAEQNESYEIPLPQYDLFNFRSPAVETAFQQTEDAISSRYSGAWKVYSWNPQTGTPRAVYGSGIQIAPPFTSAQDVVSAANSVIQANPSVFKADLGNLRFHSAPQGAGKWAVHFQQTYHMLDVWGADLFLVFTDGGRLFAMGSNYYSGIDLDWNPSIPREVAKEIAKSDLPFNAATDKVEEAATLLVLPVARSETDVEHHLVWRIRVQTEDPLGIWVTHVDAHSGAIVWRYNDVHFVDYTGTTAGQIQRPSYCEGQAQETMPYLRIQITGLPPVYADGTGNWTVPYALNDSRPLTADLYSPYVDLNNMAVGPPEGAFSGTAVPGVPLQVAFTDLNSQSDEKDVYRAVNDIHDFFQIVDPTFPYANQRITANVSRTQTCNAFWNGTINFYNEGGGCGNTGEIMGVVHHEFGHGVQDAILGWQGDQGLGEGNGDVLANLMTLESWIGRGFYLNQCTSGLRNSENSLRYPGDVIGVEIHDAGRVIAGFHWDALQRLQQVYGTEQGQLMAAETWHFGRLLVHPTTQPDQVLATFIADDDDGDLTNGTPNYDAYCEGATNHGFVCPPILVGVIIQHTPLATRTTAGDAAVIATITSTESALVPDSLRVRYRLNGGALQWTQMTPTGNLNEYSALITGLSVPTEVEYYIRGRDTAGNTRNAPPLAPADLYAFDVANVFDNLEGESGWTVNLEGGDNASSGIWLRADPVGTSAQPEDDHTVNPGVVCWVTGNANPGDPLGQNDVDGGTTTLYSPAYDLTGANVAEAKYYRWYSNDTGGAPGEDHWVVQARNNGGAWVGLEDTQQSAASWNIRSFDLAAVFGPSIGTVQFRFVASDLNSGSLVEAAVDDFELLYQASADAPQGASSVLRYALAGSRPNPVRNSAAIAFQVPVASRVHLTVHDVNGRLVRELADDSFEAGEHTLTWDRTDGRGHQVASGVYYFRMQANEFHATRTVVLTR